MVTIPLSARDYRLISNRREWLGFAVYETSDIIGYARPVGGGGYIKRLGAPNM